MKRMVLLGSTVTAAAEEVREEMAILDSEVGTYYGLDNVGPRVRELIQGLERAGKNRVYSWKSAWSKPTAAIEICSRCYEN